MPLASSDVALDALVVRLREQAPPGLQIGTRVIEDDDASHLLAVERASITARHAHQLRQSGAARAVAHALLRDLDAIDISIPRAKSGAPVWPAGFCGSLAHDDTIAVAAVARSTLFQSVGIDVEPTAALPNGVELIVKTPSDRIAFPLTDISVRILFCAKEAVFKAVFPLDGKVLGFDEVLVDLERGLARTPGRSGIRVHTEIGTHILALAYIC